MKKRFARKDIVGVFISPYKEGKKCSGDLEDFEFLKIDYQDLLDNVLEPLLFLDAPQETRFIIRDYVINLEKPVKERDKNDNIIDKEDTILAVSETKENDFQKIYDEYTSVLNASLYAKNRKKHIAEFRKVYPEYKDFQRLSDNDCELLESFWNSNNTLLKMIMSSVLEERAISDSGEDLSNKIDVLLNVKRNNRDNTKSLVYDKNHNLMNEKFGNGKPVSKSIASFFIFKAWVLDPDQNATLDNIRKAFPVAICAKHYNKMYQYLFYKSDTKHIIDSSDETNDNLPENKIYAGHAFYKGNNVKKYHLDLRDVKNVVCVKKWLKDEFDSLVEHAKQYGISVESV